MKLIQSCRGSIYLAALVVMGELLFSSSLFADAVTDYNLAVQFYKQQRWKLAAEACEEFVKKYPTHGQVPMAQLYWGQSLVHLRDFANARLRFQDYLKDPRATTDRALAMYRIGESSYFLNKLPDAEVELTAFLKDHEKHDLAEWAIVYLAQTKFQLNKIPDAIQLFELSLTRYPEGKLKGEAEYGLARAYEASGQAQSALTMYARIADQESHPQAVNAMFHLSAVNFSLGKYDEADRGFQAIAKKFPEDRLVPLAYLNSGYAKYQLRQYAEAIEQFKKAATVDSQKDVANYWIALSYKSLGEYDQAETIFSQILEGTSDSPLAESIIFQAGDTALRLADYDQALSRFAQVYSKWPEGAYADDALHSACEAAMLKGDLAKAAELHQLFSDRYAAGGLRQVQDLLYGRVLIAMGDEVREAVGTGTSQERAAFYRKASEVLKSVMDSSMVDETTRFARFQLARAYERLNNDQQVIELIDPGLSQKEKLDQLDLDGLILVANAKLREKDYDGAISSYQRFLGQVTKPELRLIGYTGLTSALVAQQDWSAVEPSLQQLAKLDVDDKHYSQLSLAAGDAAFEQENWKSAEQFFKLASAHEVGNEHFPAALSGLGHTYYRQNLFEQAVSAFQKLTSASDINDELSAHAWYMTGMSQRQAGDLKQAITSYQAGLQKFYKSTDQELSDELQMTCYGMAKAGARAARDDDQIETADDLYAKAISMLKKMPEQAKDEGDKLLFEWADLHYNAEDYEQADKIYQRLITEYPASELADDAQLILAESLRFSGNAEAANVAFRKLADSDKVDDFVKQRSYVHLVDLGAEQQNWDQVIKDAQTLMKDFPESEHQLYLQYRNAEALLQTDKIEQANTELGNLRKTIEQLSDQAPAWWENVWILQAECLLKKKDYQQLQQTVEDLRQRSPESKLIHRADLLLGRSYENQAKFEEARAAYARVIESESGKGTETAAQAQFRIAESYLKQKNFEVALKEYYKVYAGYDAPSYEAAALFQAARSDVEMKSWKGAVQTYAILLKEFPDSEYASDARKQLAEIEAAFPELKRDSP